MEKRRKLKTKKIAMFVEKIGDQYVLRKKQDVVIKEGREVIEYEGSAYFLPKGETYNEGRKHYVFFDIGNKKILAFNQIELGYDAEMLEMFVFKKIVGQLVSRIQSQLATTDKGKLLMYIVVFAFGGLVGYMISQSIAGSTGTAKAALMGVKAWL